MKRFIILLLAFSFLATGCATSKLPNGRKKHQGCAQGRNW